jgi:predicted RNase H-like nuclease (RuvC/YqgF family)
MPLDLLRDAAVLLTSLIAIASALYIARNKGIIANYRATVESQDARIKSLEAENSDLRDRVSKLEGQREGYEFAAEVWVKAVTNAGICAKAWACEMREIPQADTGKRRK